LENGEEGRLRRRKKFDGGENKARGRTCGTKGIFQKLVEKGEFPDQRQLSLISRYAFVLRFVP
jgi:hypothetical protein